METIFGLPIETENGIAIKMIASEMRRNPNNVPRIRSESERSRLGISPMNLIGFGCVSTISEPVAMRKLKTELRTECVRLKDVVLSSKEVVTASRIMTAANQTMKMIVEARQPLNGDRLKSWDDESEFVFFIDRNQSRHSIK